MTARHAPRFGDAGTLCGSLALMVVAGCSRPKANEPVGEPRPATSHRTGESSSSPSSLPARTAPLPPASSKPDVPPADAPPAVRLAIGADKAFGEALEAVATKSLEGVVGKARYELLDAWQVRFPKTERVVVALRVEQERFALGVVDQRSKQGTWIPGVDYRGCKQIRFLAADDLNGDDIADFQYTMLVPSNRYPADVDVRLVYLSIAAEASYCFSEHLSDFADSTVPSLGHSVTPAAARSLAERLGPRAFECRAPLP